MRALSKPTIFVLGAGILAACGGGGDDGGGDSGPVVRESLALNAGNGQRVAIAVVEDSEDLAGGGPSVVLSASAETHGDGLVGVRGLAYGIALKSLAAGMPFGGTFAPEQTQTQNCPDGGSVSGSLNDNNGNQQLDAGESVSITYNNCRHDTVVQNGTVTLEVVTLQGEPGSSSADWAFKFSFRFDDFSVRGTGQPFTLDGGFSLAASFDFSAGRHRLTTAGSELSYTEGTERARLVNFSFAATELEATSRQTAKYNFVYDANNLAGSVTVVTNVPFRAVEGFPPESGKLTIKGANNTRVVVQATGGGTARISIDANGDGDFTDSGDKVINGQWTTFFG